MNLVTRYVYLMPYKMINFLHDWWKKKKSETEKKGFGIRSVNLLVFGVVTFYMIGGRKKIRN